MQRGLGIASIMKGTERAKRAFCLMASRSEREMHARTLQELLYRVKHRLEHDVLQALFDAQNTTKPDWGIEAARSHCQWCIDEIEEDPTYQQYERERVESEECHRRWELAAARDGREAVHGGVSAQSAAGPG